MQDTSFDLINKDQNTSIGEPGGRMRSEQKKSQKKPKVPKKISERYLHNSGLAYLQRFATSSAHFKTVMMRKIDKSCRHHKDQNKDDCEGLLDELIPKFQELGLLNDDAYIRGVVTSCRRRGLSSAKIKQKLAQKGINQDLIETAISEYDVENDSGDFPSALIFIKKKKLGAYDLDQKKDYQKSLAMMARAGFQYGIAEKALNLTPEQIEEEFNYLL
ncbi:MAG: RecX family transcriptional regulator [Alphaproteobacteria bacterium]|nr:RecX family transcriptional regulator [Alphaproteobacteria bacterium]